MMSNSPKSQRVKALVVTVPLLFAVPTAAHADPDKLLQAAAGTASFETSDVSAGLPAWHWKSDPEAYEPDGLSDYSEDFAVAGTQAASPETIRHREAKNRIGAAQAR